MLRLAILASIFCLSSTVFSMQEERKIKEVVFNPKCIKTIPCQHYVTITYEDKELGELTEAPTALTSRAIAESYWDFLPLKAKYHLLCDPQVYSLKAHLFGAN